MSNRINKGNVMWLYLAIMCFIVFGLYAVLRFRLVTPDASPSSLLSGWDMDKLRALGIYLIAVNVVTFGLFSWDKHVAASARGHGSRTPEAYLLGLCLGGGAIGGMLAMSLVRHKTRKWYFVWGLPLFMLMDVALVIFAHMCGMI